MGVLIGGRRQEICEECRKTALSGVGGDRRRGANGSEGSSANCIRGREISERRVGILLV